jgi:hypothetical protein
LYLICTHVWPFLRRWHAQFAYRVSWDELSTLKEDHPKCTNSFRVPCDISRTRYVARLVVVFITADNENVVAVTFNWRQLLNSSNLPSQSHIAVLISIPTFGAYVPACKPQGTLPNLPGDHGPTTVCDANAISSITWYMFGARVNIYTVLSASIIG